MQIGQLNLLDFGNTVLLCGAVFSDQNNNLHALLMPGVSSNIPRVEELTLDQWKELIKQTDLKIVEVTEGDPLKKSLVRKCERSIEARISWNVYKRDNYSCRYCGTDGPLTVDHLILWEELGPSIEENLVSSCGKCNKMRGNIQYPDWLNSNPYKERSKNLPDSVKQANLDLIPTLSSIPRRSSQKSR